MGETESGFHAWNAASTFSPKKSKPFGYWRVVAPTDNLLAGVRDNIRFGGNDYGVGGDRGGAADGAAAALRTEKWWHGRWRRGGAADSVAAAPRIAYWKQGKQRGGGVTNSVAVARGTV